MFKVFKVEIAYIGMKRMQRKLKVENTQKFVERILKKYCFFVTSEFWLKKEMEKYFKNKKENEGEIQLLFDIFGQLSSRYLWHSSFSSDFRQLGLFQPEFTCDKKAIKLILVFLIHSTNF